MIKKLRYKIQEFPVEKISRFTYIAQQITPSAAQVALWLSAIYGIIHECCGEQFFTFTSAKGELAPHLPRLRLVGQNDLPLVETFVPCCGESLDIILDTARAACAIDYPTARFCVTVLDDGNSAALHKAIADLCKIWPNLSYHSRGVKPNVKVFAKAGNLNYGLFEIKRPFPPEFIAVMDADYMPTPDFLRATLPHMLTRSKLAIVESAQYYYNLPDGDPLDQALDYYSAIKIPQLNRLGKSFASGSGCVIRYNTLLKTGGFPTFGSVEAVTLSSILTQSGYQILVLTEMAQLGCSIWPLRYPNRKLSLGPHPTHAQAVFPKEDVRLAVMKRQRPPLGEFYHLVLVPVVLAALMYFALVV
ncbi:hypothetical protein G4B84_010336 [Aspergillus flavus NRRL3357]|nr:uncharacterized protein G4B84_010336 [Aspergillus flavus NRRL3357]QMW34845.1 hypothetical protein G4B84_010336 [Aspergillus flavus NRRL3357]